MTRTPSIRIGGRPPMPRSQRGTMLIVALIVLVALTLAGIATMRSVDTATVMAGNIAFRQSVLGSADQGIQAGFALLQGTNNDPTHTQNLSKDGLGVSKGGYYSSASPVEPDWSDPNAWNTSGSRAVAQLNGGAPDSAGNVISFIVERLCRIPNCDPGGLCGGQTNTCGSTPNTGKAFGREGDNNFEPQDAFNAPAMHYRITARAVGPRNSIAILQTLTR